eukprot:gene2242-2554_t
MPVADVVVDVREPLLPGNADISGHQEPPPAKQEVQQHSQTTTASQATTTFWHCTFNLAKVITGAGMMSIPRAFAFIGWLPGTLMLMGVAGLTYFTLAVLVQGTQSFNAPTYPRLVLVTCGRSTAKLLQVAVLAFLFGFNVVYLVVIKDILVGAGSNGGLLSELFHLPADSIWVQPHIVLTSVALLCAPLLLMRSMDKLAVFNILGVGATILLAVTAAALGVAAVVQGSAHTIPMMPRWNMLGPTKVAQLESLTEVLPVVLACYVAHQSLHPLMPLLKPYSPRRMCAVIATALGMVLCIFLLLSVGACVAFGLEVDPNVLNNISEQGMTPLVGHVLADVLSLVIRGGYMVSLVANLLLYVHPLRSYISEIIWPESDASSSTTACWPVPTRSARSLPGASEEAAASSGKAADPAGTPIADPSTASKAIVSAAVPEELPPVTLHDVAVQAAHMSQAEQENQEQPTPQGYVVAADPTEASVGPAAPVLLLWQQQEQRWYYLMTYSLLAIILMCAVFVPNIWAALSAIGDLASTIQAFVIPGAIALEWLGVSSSFADWAELLLLRGLGALVMVLGGALFVNGIVQRIT